eukprot:jgi/Mesvir1/2847/Mv13933-RA.1
MKGKVAVVGAGVSGAVCASILAKNGVEVMVFEKGRGAGGRASSRRETWMDAATGAECTAHFDHGAQQIAPEDKRVVAWLKGLQEQGVVALWEGRIGSISGGVFTKEHNAKKRYVGVPGMSAIPKALVDSEGVSVRYGVQVSGMCWQEGAWELTDQGGVSLGRFDGVVAADRMLSNPRHQTLFGVPPPLVSAGVPSIAQQISVVEADPCFVLMLAFREPLTDLPLDGATLTDSPNLAWVARDSSKPQRRLSGAGKGGPAMETWVVQSTRAFAVQVLEQAGATGVPPPQDMLAHVADTLLASFKREMAAVMGVSSDTIPDPVFKKAHRWGGAFPTNCLSQPCLVDEGRILAACGDYCLAPTMEAAAISGMTAAAAVIDCLRKSSRL